MVNQLRLDPLTGRWVTVASGRGSRPDDFAHDPAVVETPSAGPCPFCPGHEEETPPALETYGRDGAWLLRVVPNKYPAFEGTGTMLVDQLGPLFAQAPATGIHEVLVLSPSHTASFADLDDPQAGLAMAALRDRFEDHAHSSGIRYSQAIINHGRAAGASIQHPHGQILGIPFVPDGLLDEIASFRRFSGGCLLCATVEAERDAGHRLVADEGGVVVVAPWWSSSPFELLVIPEGHHPRFHETDPGCLANTGRALRNALRRLRNLLGDVPYNVVLHTLPHHGDDPFHWHLHVTPRVQSTGGFEQGTGVPINIVAPEDACRLLTG